MIDCNKGLVSFIEEQNENVIVSYCFLHREALMSRTLGEDLGEVLDQDFKMVTFIKIIPVESCLFEQISTNMVSQHRRLHTFAH